jgi:hypothetical protein
MIKVNHLPDERILKSAKSDQKIKIDLEPFWEDDPRTIFRARVDGVLKFSFSPSTLFSEIVASSSGNAYVFCNCGIPTLEISVSSRTRVGECVVAKWSTTLMYIETFGRSCAHLAAFTLLYIL